MAAVRRIPRPPAALHQLLSPQFRDSASSNELSELITGEAQIAAKVLATVNAPYYGLKRPVAGIGQAVTFLGLNTVRSIGLQNLLDDSFKPTDARLKRAYGEIWNASALCTRLPASWACRTPVPWRHRCCCRSRATWPRPRCWPRRTPTSRWPAGRCSTAPATRRTGWA